MAPPRYLFPDAESKLCKKCSTRRPLADFHRSKYTNDGRQSYCKFCAAAKRQAWRAANPEKTRAFDRRHNRKRNSVPRTEAQRQTQRRVHLMRRYGISPEEFDALLVKQHGRCAICPQLVGDGSGRPLHVDHDHATGRVRGLLCTNCNTALGSFGESADRLRVALAYLEGTHDVPLYAGEKLHPNVGEAN